MFINAKRPGDFVKSAMNRRYLFMAAVTAALFAFRFNPLANTEIAEWDRTFSELTLAGYSIDARVGSMYRFLLIVIPVLFVFFLLSYGFICEKRKNYADIFLKFNILMAAAVTASWIAKYADAGAAAENALLAVLFRFWIFLFLTALADRKGLMTFGDAVVFFLLLLIGAVSGLAFFDIPFRLGVNAGAVIILLLAVFALHPVLRENVYDILRNIFCLAMWLPAAARFVLELVYILAEKGVAVPSVFAVVFGCSAMFFVLGAAAVFIFRKKKPDLIGAGYAGAILSFCIVAFIQFGYHYYWSMPSTARIYEAGNNCIAVNTILYGKIPIVDYFSAHALADVWTQILYGLIHSDAKAVLSNPYGGLDGTIAIFCLYYIFKKLFDRDSAVLFVLMLPLFVSGAKIAVIGFLCVAALLFLLERPGLKRYIPFWILTLIGALTRYDEGVFLGLGCIAAYMFVRVTQKKWKDVGAFVLTGCAVGGAVLVWFFIYSRMSGFDAVSRIREWLSVGAGSSSTWATESFGDGSKAAFMLIYFAAPLTAAGIFAAAAVLFVRTGGKHVLNAALTIAFSLTGLLFLQRMIVFQNYRVNPDNIGVLFNVLHWTIASFILYLARVRERSVCRGLLVWTGGFMIALLAEGMILGGIAPTSSSLLFNRTADKAVSWELRECDAEELKGDRIQPTESAAAYVKPFNLVFDTLLEDEQTFIDFANVTSLYAVTGRKWPCYVSQTPSLLTDLYSQACYLEQIEAADCPLALLGTTTSNYITGMAWVPLNVRYYTIAEYIYSGYRPLVKFGEFVIWCDKDRYDEYREKLSAADTESLGIAEADYGYDAAAAAENENGERNYTYRPLHNADLKKLPYVWANADMRHASDNAVLTEVNRTGENVFTFEGSQSVLSENGCYLALTCTNDAGGEREIGVVLFDSVNPDIRSYYSLDAVPGTSDYLIRISADYFWDVYNIDTLQVSSDNNVLIDKIRILEGDRGVE